MRTVAFGIEKGGVGKTTLSVCVAAELAQRHKTLLLDLDIQGHASSWAVEREDGTANVKGELADVLYGRMSFSDCLCSTFQDGLYCLPTFGGNGLLGEFVEGKIQKDMFCIKAVVQEAESKGFEFCIIDLSPGFVGLERCAYIAADEVITPIIPSAMSVDSLDIFTKKIIELRQSMQRGGVKIASYSKLVLNSINKSLSYHRVFLDNLSQETKLKIFIVPTDQAFNRARLHHCGIRTVEPKKETMETMKKLTEAIEEC
jgi:chromosome partitioning protein